MKVSFGSISLAGASSREAGFTLLEILVALAILGFITAGLAQGMHLSLLARGIELGVAGVNDDLTTLDRIVRRVVEGMDPGDDLDPAPMLGSRDRLDCLTVLSSVDGPLPGRRMQAMLLIDPQHRLVLRWRPYPRATRIGDMPLLSETELLRDVSAIEFAFKRRTGAWISTWRSADLPALVRVRVTFPAHDGRHWPDIVVAPQRDRP